MKQADGPHRDVRSELRRLRGASGGELRAHDEMLKARRTEWYWRHAGIPQGGDLLEQAYQVLLRKLGISEEEAPVVRKDARVLVFHSKNFCPTLEACRILGLDTRRVCRLSSEKSTDALVKLVDPSLRFSRNYKRIRPFSEYCEEMISVEGPQERRSNAPGGASREPCS